MKTLRVKVGASKMKRTGYVMVPVKIDYEWKDNHPYCVVTNVEAPTAADCARSYAASATVYETKDKAFKDF